MLTLDLSLVQSFLAQVTALAAGGAGLWLSVRTAKKLAPWLQGKTTILRVGGMALAALGTVSVKAATGALEGADLQELALTLLEAASVWATAHAAHKLTKPKA